MTLTEFLLRRIAEDETRITRHNYWCSCSQVADAECDCPTRRVVAECEAKRRIVEELAEAMAYDDRIGEAISTTAYAGIRALSWLALPYADHPDYREEWEV